MKLFSNWKKLKTLVKEKTIADQKVSNFLYKPILAILIAFLIVMLMPSKRPFEYSNLKVGSISPEEIIAPFTFPIIKSAEELNREREAARLNIPAVFQKDTDLQNVQLLKLETMFDEISGFFGQKFKNYKKMAKLDSNFSEFALMDSMVEKISVKYDVTLSADDIIELFTLHKNSKLREFNQNFRLSFSQIYKSGLINRSKSDIAELKIILIQNGLEEEVSLERVSDLNEANEILNDFLTNRYSEHQNVLSIASRIVAAFLIPDLIFDAELTASRKDKAAHNVAQTNGFVHEDQRIIDSHEIVTDEIYQKLLSLDMALAESSETKSTLHRLLFYFGESIFAIVITFLFGFYLFYYRPALFSKNKVLVMITLVFVLQFLTAGFALKVLNWHYLSIPIILGPMLFAMLLDASLAFFGTVIIAIVLGAIGGNNYHLALMTIIVGTISLYSVQKIRNRGQMFRAIFYVILGYAAINFSYGFMHFEEWNKMLQDFVVYQVPNAILVPTAVFLLIGVFEKFFDVTTDITLLELSDLNHPLLKRLSVEAPGTFHHSITVGNLAEAAAKEIGANSLLARVGCYYHDIGKMLLTEYFVENQSNAVSKHESLTPHMSSLILAKHVRAGIELAEEHGLPLAVRKFIPDPHGTSTMSYFYHKAQETMPAKDINQNDFKYPGPKPQSKETAIAMLSDTVEAAARSLPNPNLQRISALVENLIEKRFQEGELDECDITLRELNKIKDAFVHILMGIHHIRIEYPSDEKKKEKSKKQSTVKKENSGNDSEKPDHLTDDTESPNNEKKAFMPTNQKVESDKKENSHSTDK
jgi:putative nucleotidyltransferase with HDIG domain